MRFFNTYYITGCSYLLFFNRLHKTAQEHINYRYSNPIYIKNIITPGTNFVVIEVVKHNHYIIREGMLWLFPQC